MPKLSSYKRIVTNDYPKEERKFVEQIAGPINDSFNELYFALNGRLSLVDNLNCTVRTIDIIVDSNGLPTDLTTITTNKTTSVFGCNVVSAVNQSNTALYPTGAPFISYSAISGGILVNHVTGLQANNRYTLNIIIWHV